MLRLCHVVFDLFVFPIISLQGTFINICTMRIIEEFKPAYFFHLYVNEGGNFHLMRSHTYLSEVSVQNN